MHTSLHVLYCITQNLFVAFSCYEGFSSVTLKNGAEPSTIKLGRRRSPWTYPLLCSSLTTNFILLIHVSSRLRISGESMMVDTDDTKPECLLCPWVEYPEKNLMGIILFSLLIEKSAHGVNELVHIVLESDMVFRGLGPGIHSIIKATKPMIQKRKRWYLVTCRVVITKFLIIFGAKMRKFLMIANLRSLRLSYLYPDPGFCLLRIIPSEPESLPGTSESIRRLSSFKMFSPVIVRLPPS
ncbi:hypothetical protein EDB92DRAFT_1830745 [Lactarius akahatsu]|uniref:Uncharacterized protein n=1 Tax=Lactarius akahatsu TaxID=416441 RepID=A0AAD4LUK9_9AGAM|nr:hypothetical protein EDB92DRAFT_1830745 [Lactarius akahatsu]